MKALNSFETQQVAGGTIINVANHPIIVNTIGIPDKCVNQYQALLNDMYVVANAPTISMEVAMGVMGKHLDIMDRSGCSDYIETLGNRISSAMI